MRPDQKVYEAPTVFIALCRGFTKFSRDDYIQWKKEGRLVNDGVNAKVGHIKPAACVVRACALSLLQRQ